ncbi:MAG TPA: MFS transporter [Acidimicrobiia bacterium]|nr:MFS transporter [Acidimicrobiia bacterium]
MLVSVNLVDGASDSIVAGVLPLLQDEWGFSDTLGGAIPTAAALIGIVVLLPAGWMADHLRRTRILAVVVGAWALLTTASALATAFWIFFATRLVLGAANHFDNPPASSLLADFYPARIRGRVFGYQRVAHTLGGAFGILIGGVVGQLLGWRAPFLVMVVPGVIVAFACLSLREPARGESDRLDEEIDDETDAELAAELGPRLGAREYLREVRAVLRIPTIRLLYLGLTVTFLGLNAIAFWLPSFLERSYDLGEGAAAAITGGIGLPAALAGSVVGGAWGDRRAAVARRERIALMNTTLLVGALGVIVAFAFRVLAIQMFISLFAVFFILVSVPNFAAATAEVLPARRRGTGFAAFTFVLVAGGALGPLLVGLLSDATGSLRFALAAAALPAIPGAFVLRRAAHTIDADAEAALGTAQ